MEPITVYSNGGNGSNRSDLNSKPYALYRESWERLHGLIQSNMDDIFRAMFDKIIQFIDGSHSSIEPKYSFEPVSGSIVSDKQIPTALLLAGVNTPDHQILYDRIQSSVRARGGLVAVVNPGSDTSSSRALMSAVVRQFLQGDASVVPVERNFDIYSESDEEMSNAILAPGSVDLDCCDEFMRQFPPSVRHTYWALSEWYHHKTQLNQKAEIQKSVNLNTARNSRRSLSQPGSRHAMKCSRPLRSSLFPRTNPIDCASTPVKSRRYTVRPEVRPTDVPMAMETSSPPSSRIDAGTASSNALVIILPQSEAIPCHVVQDFIEMTSAYLSGKSTADCSHSLPICLVLGLSTSPEVGFEARLNASTLSRLRVKWFTVPPPAVFLDAVFSALLDFPGFHLTHSMCTYLVDSLFLCLDYSVQNFIRRLQFCMLEHYLNTPHPELLLPSDKALTYLKKLSSTDLASMVSLSFPSIAHLAAHNSPSPPRLPTVAQSTSPVLVDRLATQLASHWHLQYLVGPVLKWMLELSTSATVPTLGKSVSEMYRRWLKNGLVCSEEFITFKNLLGALSKEELVRSLEKAAMVLESTLEVRSTVQTLSSVDLWPESLRIACNRRLTELVTATRSWCKVLSTADPDLLTTSVTSPQKDSPVITAPVSGQQISLPDKRKKLSIRGLRQHIQAVAAASPARYASPRAHQSQTDLARKVGEFIAWLTSQLLQLIPSPTSLPLHEVFYGPACSGNEESLKSRGSTDQPPVGGSLVLRRRLNPPYQKCLHQALIDPGQYLQIPEFHLESPDSLSPNLPDLSILYKLHLESTKMINLYDWLMAFSAILDENVASDRPPAKLIQARFFHGLAQLYHMGYIKSTKRKADHVLRLTWSLAS